MKIEPGREFTHPTKLDPDWRPEPGQRYADAPKARCVVTSVRGAVVYYRYATDRTPHGKFKALATNLFPDTTT
jgi:hypothetical protein